MKFPKILPSVSLAALATLSGATAYAQPKSAKVVLSVNDTKGVGALGDGALSLDEAIRLANGTLAFDRLSPGERAQVQGRPGARSRDLVSLPRGAVLSLAKGAAISPLAGNDGDTIEGNEATLVSGEAQKGTGLAVLSSNFVLRNLRLRDFGTAVDVDFGGRRLANISLERLRTNGLISVGATKSNGSLRGVSIADGVFDTEDKPGIRSLVYLRAAATSREPRVDNVTLDGVRLVRNRIHGGGLGLYLTGSMSAGRTTNAITRNVVVADNVFTGQNDAAINFLGGLPAGGGHHTKVGLENVVATGNRVETANWGFYMGNELFGAWRGMPAGSMTDSFFRNIRVERNTITRNSKGSVGHCISIENSADFRGDVASNNVMENVRIADNDISGCVEMTRPGRTLLPLGAAIYVNAGRSAINHMDAGGTARNNVARNIAIINNRIKDSTRGIVINGGYNRFLSPPADVRIATGNSLTGLRIEGNTLENNPTGIRVTGGDGAEGSTVTGNSVTGVTIRGNRISGSLIACEAIANAGTARGNTLDARCPAPGR